jgi:hypothetical protein
MSVDRSITIELLADKQKITDCLAALFSDHWTPFDENGKITYLPVGVTDGADTTTDGSLETLYQVIQEKEIRQEFGLIYIWDLQHEESHCLLIFPETGKDSYNRFKLLFSLGSAKRLVGSQRQTDFSHYLSKIIPVLETNNFLFESITCIDFG